MTTIDEAQLLTHARRIQGKVIVLTGGANGIGRETAILFAQYGAKIVIGDISSDAASKVVQEIHEQGGKATYFRCNVLHWDDQVALFEGAVAQFGSVDVVVPIAGMTEHGSACSGVLDYQDGRPLPPDMSTLEVNLLGALYTVHLGLDYLRSTRTGPSQWKALVLMGSMASWEAIPLAPMYTSSKYAIRGLMRSLYPLVKRDDIRIACIDPVWADTKLLPVAARIVLVGSRLLPVSRIAQTVLYAAADPDEETSGCSWLLPDTGPVLRLERENIHEGTYKMINDRIARFKIFERDAKLAARQVWVILRMGFRTGFILMGVMGVIFVCFGRLV